MTSVCSSQAGASIGPVSSDTVRFVEDGCAVVCVPLGPWAPAARVDLASAMGSGHVLEEALGLIGQPQQVLTQSLIHAPLTV